MRLLANDLGPAKNCFIYLPVQALFQRAQIRFPCNELLK